ncbi:small-subunit processome [Catenaria anguillulae PL171]|uniref:U3 small nucleolar RNA-associated protein 11 n=1 Tax=Catenaria anguillulae PL171 TaxID=765915 RepID=A0A1Y2HLN6_9FUNG|nr:small-subunit processome [Catenaria anguillulae PL171]
MSSTSLRKVAPRRTHKERAQPAARRKLGLLEKHKDYVLRARDFHSKEDRVKRMREKARLRNPDEFYFAMEKATTKKGVHVVEGRQEKYSADFLKLLKTQDKGYIANQRSVNAKKLEKLKAQLHLVGAEHLADSAASSGAYSDDEDTPSIPKSTHTVFVDSETEADSFDPEEHFDTPAEFLARKFNRPTRSMLSTAALPDVKRQVDPMEVTRAERERAAKYTELAGRLERDEQLRAAELELDVQKALMGKGRRKKVGEDARGLAMYKWRAERKK